jgi:hypothetical protein
MFPMAMERLGGCLPKTQSIASHIDYFGKKKNHVLVRFDKLFVRCSVILAAVIAHDS